MPHKPHNPFSTISEADYHASEREADRVAAFCKSGLGHQNVIVDEQPDGTKVTYCDDCGTEFPNG